MPATGPGEFTESMCNPWTHDFRDCACHYWAAAALIVFGPAGTAPKGRMRSPSSVRREETRFDWLRAFVERPGMLPHPERSREPAVSS